MPIFRCSKCGVMENTATSNYWWRVHEEKKEPLCSQCDPETGKWHGLFERQEVPDDHVIGPDGFVHHRDDPYLARLLKEKGGKT